MCGLFGEYLDYRRDILGILDPKRRFWDEIELGTHVEGDETYDGLDLHGLMSILGVLALEVEEYGCYGSYQQGFFIRHGQCQDIKGSCLCSCPCVCDPEM